MPVRSPSRPNRAGTERRADPFLRPRSAVATLVVLALAFTACGTSGRELRDPPPGATAPPRPSSTSSTAPSTIAPIGLSIVSSAWAPGGEMPGTFACDGADVSPPLTVGGAADDVVELVVVVTIPAADDPVRWVVAGLAPGTTVFEQGAVPDAAVVAQNSAGELTWAGPCPDPGDTQFVDFAVYAFTAPSEITADTTAADAEELANATAVASAAMTGTYTREP
jgi:phosphatidylethanolamine-binding protein (PEBP) family uncharacterized protein